MRQPDTASSHDDDIVARTFELAETALAAGERPVAALLVRDGTVVAEAIDVVFARSDPTAHAERIVLSDYCTGRGLLHLRGHDLYCFIEPCMMCCGAIHWAKLDRVVFALSQARLNELSGGLHKPGIRELLPLGRRSPAVVGPVREDEAAEVAARYDWRARRL